MCNNHALACCSQNLSHPDAAGAWLSALALLHGVFNVAVFFSSHGSVPQAWRDCCGWLNCCLRRCRCYAYCAPRSDVRASSAFLHRSLIQQGSSTVYSSISEPWSPLGALWPVDPLAAPADTRDEEMPSPVSDPTLEAWWEGWSGSTRESSGGGAAVAASPASRGVVQAVPNRR